MADGLSPRFSSAFLSLSLFRRTREGSGEIGERSEKLSAATGQPRRLGQFVRRPTRSAFKAFRDSLPAIFHPRSLRSLSSNFLALRGRIPRSDTLRNLFEKVSSIFEEAEEGRKKERVSFDFGGCLRDKIKRNRLPSAWKLDRAGQKFERGGGLAAFPLRGEGSRRVIDR